MQRIISSFSLKKEKKKFHNLQIYESNCILIANVIITFTENKKENERKDEINMHLKINKKFPLPKK